MKNVKTTTTSTRSSSGGLTSTAMTTTLPILALVVTLAVFASTTSAFQLFASSSGHGCPLSPDTRTIVTDDLHSHDSCACVPDDQCQVDRGRQPLGARLGAMAALRRAVSRGMTRARDSLAKATTSATKYFNQKKHEQDPALLEHHEHQRGAFEELVDILNDIERQLFLAVPATTRPLLADDDALTDAPATPLASAFRGRNNNNNNNNPRLFPQLWPGNNNNNFFPQLFGGGRGSGTTEEDSPASWSFQEMLRSAMDVKENPEAFTFTADVPGMNDADLAVEVDEQERVLTVRGKRVDDFVDGENLEEEKDAAAAAAAASAAAAGTTATVPPKAPRYHRRERHFGSFENRYALPPAADVARVTASTEKGVLTVTVPKLPKDESPEAARSTRKIHVSRQ